MNGQGRPRALAWALPSAFLLALAIARADDTQPHLRSMQEDAELTDVCFVDPQRGWAVGDRGVIWSTVDGGRKWSLQDSGVSCRLESVCFIDANVGWVAGGASQPYTHATRGVLLHTRDGGRTWQRDATLLLPALKQVRFFNGVHGWAISESSALFPSGVVTTDNGGRTWSSLSAPAPQAWLAADFLDPHTGSVAGRLGALALVRRHALEPSQTPSLGLRGLHRLRLVGPTGGWLVGDGNTVLTTADLGRSWQTPEGDHAAVVGDEFDWRALEVRGSMLWIAGAPGTRVLHSPDGGRAWQAFGTGHVLPICDLCFVDERQGWAVGALGTILATDDGGHTWKRQRAGGTRAAVVGLFSEPAAVPLELFARLAGQEGYLSQVHLINRRDLEAARADSATLADRARAALVALGAHGAETAWAFPLRQAGLGLSAEQLVEGWNRAHDGHGIERLEAHLVRQIRVWRPDIVVTHATSPRGDDPLGHLLNQIVLRAVEQAGDATRFPEQLAQQGLEPWLPRKVVGSLPAGSLGSLNVTTAQLAPRLGSSLVDAADAARGLLADRFAPAPATLGFQLLVDRVPQGAGQQDFMSGLVHYPGSEARRLQADVPDEGVDLMRRVAHKSRSLQAILSRADGRGLDPARFLAQITDLTSGLDDRAAGDVLFQLAQQYAQMGRADAAAETFQVLTERLPGHVLTPTALVWLVQFHASGETAWRAARKTTSAPTAIPEAQLVQFASPLGQLARADLAVPPPHAPKRAVDRSHLSRAGLASLYGNQLEQLAPGLYGEPSVQFPLCVAWTEQGGGQQAQKFQLAFSRSRPRDAWWSCAAGEQWLQEGKGEPPKPTWNVAAVKTKPRLDGRLDEELWPNISGIELHSPLRDDANWPAVVRAAHDAEYLYLAVTCREAPGVAYPAATGARPRDPDLSRHDRVELYLDIDRDYASWYRLVVDHRGWVADECFGDKSWNPTWFVAARQADGAWTVEAAIPLSELGPKAGAARSVWAAGAQRLVPGAGFQSWTLPAAAEAVPEGFGWLAFE